MEYFYCYLYRNFDIMSKTTVINFREAIKSDLPFLSEILVNAAIASGVNISVGDLVIHPDSYQYVEEFPKGADIGIIAETLEGHLVGAAWIRLLPTDAHAIHEPLPELTMGVIPELYFRLIFPVCEHFKD